MVTTKARFTPDELKAISDGFETKSPEDILRWAFDTFGDKAGLGMSFGGASGAMLLDIAVKINPKVHVFYLDTDFLFPETYANVEAVKQRYHIRPVAFKSRLTPEAQAAKHGAELWKSDPDQCCALRKVEPNERALAGLDAWITGIRRDQGDTRKQVGIVEWNEKFGLVKINAVAHLSKKDIWDYVLKHKVPYNVLLDQGYKSIGCTHCTRAVGEGEDERAGRWSGTGKTECGLHT
ncbi:MAG: phosphoadenylyl-sulfate reductase [Chloroflexi bacterium]|nr:phosphoadenylyl-sulfate reductase [Chloroflexota bacterium]